MEIIDEFINLWANIEPEAIVLLLCGLVLNVTGFIRAFNAHFMVSGTLTAAAGIGIRLAGGGGLVQLFILLFIMLAIITIAFIAVMRASKYDWIIRLPVVGDNARETKN